MHYGNVFFNLLYLQLIVSIEWIRDIILNISLHWIAQPTIKSQWPKVPLHKAVHWTSNIFWLAVNMSHHIAVSLSVRETNCLSLEHSHHAWSGHGESLLHFVYMSEKERERGGESNTSDSNLFGARSASGSNAPLCMPGICAATQNVSTQKRALTGH